MSNKSLKPLTTTLGAAVAGTLLSMGTATASENPFALKELQGGYLQMAENAKAEEGKCGGNMKAEEGKCGANIKAEEGKCGSSMKTEEAEKAAEGTRGGNLKADEGKCGAAK
jgi:uncharacterized low-complexity protein